MYVCMYVCINDIYVMHISICIYMICLCVCVCACVRVCVCVSVLPAKRGRWASPQRPALPRTQQMRAGPGADVDRSRRRCGPVPARMHRRRSQGVMMAPTEILAQQHCLALRALLDAAAANSAELAALKVCDRLGVARARTRPERRRARVRRTAPHKRRRDRRCASSRVCGGRQACADVGRSRRRCGSVPAQM
jgi:hypothetical protein